mmetsp:Transcript_10919/g.34686  ORF Transcript_10919/g.34686 Transcript_10919/m.34686 type:complete len:200 (-) Transcript_10919:2212-2811(-)
MDDPASRARPSSEALAAGVQFECTWTRSGMSSRVAARYSRTSAMPTGGRVAHASVKRAVAVAGVCCDVDECSGIEEVPVGGTCTGGSASPPATAAADRCTPATSSSSLREMTKDHCVSNPSRDAKATVDLVGSGDNSLNRTPPPPRIPVKSRGTDGRRERATRPVNVWCARAAAQKSRGSSAPLEVAAESKASASVGGT